MAVRSTILLLVASLAVVSSAGLLETLLSWELPDSEGRSTTPQSKCLCQTSGCLCCVDLNLTVTMDLGGPTCVNIRQKEENVTLNLSYGDNPVHNATTKIAEAANKPTCMNLLSDLAQICAKFTSVKSAEHGYDGCLVVEPALLGTPQATYHMGCFNFDQTVRQIEVSAITETTENTEPVEEEEEEGLNTDELIAAVSASAEQGLALFSQWLGLNLNPRLNLTNKHQVQEQPQQQQQQYQQPQQQQQQYQQQYYHHQPQQHHQQQQQQYQRQLESDPQTRSARSMMEIQTEKSDERFKQLLSAQDNVLKESAQIGQANGAQTTFVYSSPVGLAPEKESNERKATIETIGDTFQRLTVPRESRRGGRAYSIHQHVNEI